MMSSNFVAADVVVGPTPEEGRRERSCSGGGGGGAESILPDDMED